MTRHETIASGPHGPTGEETPTSDTHPLACSFNAKWLWPMKAVIDYARLLDPIRFPLGHIGVEPAPEGGVFISVFGGHALAVIHDREGSASEAVTLAIPDDAFFLCQPRQPVRLLCRGEEHVVSLPDWCHVGKAQFDENEMKVLPYIVPPEWPLATDDEEEYFHPMLFLQAAFRASRLVPGYDYRINSGIPHDWRRLLSSWMAGAFDGDTVQFNPDIPALFSSFLEVMNPDKVLATKHWLTRKGPNVMTVEGHPEFIGFWMPMREALPEHEPEEFRDIPARFLNEAVYYG